MSDPGPLTQKLKKILDNRNPEDDMKEELSEKHANKEIKLRKIKLDGYSIELDNLTKIKILIEEYNKQTGDNLDISKILHPDIIKCKRIIKVRTYENSYVMGIIRDNKNGEYGLLLSNKISHIWEDYKYWNEVLFLDENGKKKTPYRLDNDGSKILFLDECFDDWKEKHKSEISIAKLNIDFHDKFLKEKEIHMDEVFSCPSK